MQTLVEDFLQYLRQERGQSDNTAKTYAALLGKFTAWAAKQNLTDWQSVELKHLMAFLQHERARNLMPVGRASFAALTRFIEVGRPKLVTPKSPANVFLTKRGTPFASVTLWLHIKNRVRRAGVSRNMTPHMLRHSFATPL